MFCCQMTKYLLYKVCLFTLPFTLAALLRALFTALTARELCVYSTNIYFLRLSDASEGKQQQTKKAAKTANPNTDPY